MIPNLLSETDIQQTLADLPDWKRVGYGSGSVQSIQKKFTCRDFTSALKFVNEVGQLSESMDHHPDILMHGYRFVTLTLTTHSVGGLTVLDFALAQKIEAAYKEKLTT